MNHRRVLRQPRNSLPEELGQAPTVGETTRKLLIRFRNVLLDFLRLEQQACVDDHRHRPR